MADNIRDVFFLEDAVTHDVQYVSPAYEEIWGRSCESLYAAPRSWMESIHPEDQAMALVNYTKAIATGKFEFEYRIVRPDGVVRWIGARCFPVRNDAGELAGIAGVARDITEQKEIEQELLESKQRMDCIVTSAMDAIVCVDGERRIILANSAAEQMFGRATEELLGQSLDLLVPARFRAGHAVQIAAFDKAGTTIRKMGSLRPVVGIRKNGEEFPIETSISRHESNGRRFFTAIMRDITERKADEFKLRRLNRMYTVLGETNALIVRASNRDELFHGACRIAVESGDFALGWIGVVDRSAMRIVPVATFGDDKDFLRQVEGRMSLLDDAPLGHGPSAVAVRENRPVVVNDLASDPHIRNPEVHIDQGVLSLVTLPIVVAGEVVAVFGMHARETGHFDEAEMELLRELAEDLAFAIDHFRKVERLNHLAYYDALTGLANRSLFLERVALHLDVATSDGHRLAIFLIDVERFKNINDSLGQVAGDELLRQLAKWLERNVGNVSQIAHIGADLFAVVLPEVAADGDVASFVASLMGTLIEQPFPLNDAVFRIAAKAGVALFPDDGDDADALFKHAEAALKQAKAHGDRYLFYTRTMTEQVAHKPNLESQLRQALDNEEFVLHYQPKVDLATGLVSGAEALIRWNDPRTGLVPPSRFIPILEETGLIYDVGRWAMRKAIADYLRWRNAGLSAQRMAVNVSPLQMRNRGFIAEVEHAIGIDARAAAGLELEITESMVMEDIKQSVASLHAIRALGVSVAIDDFGTGFSSLGYLSKLPIDTLKVDRSFVIEMTADAQGLSLVSTIINLAHSLNLKVVAEGVETEEQKRLLRLMRCDQMQGYLFSKPVHAAEFEAKFLAPPVAAA